MKKSEATIKRNRRKRIFAIVGGFLLVAFVTADIILIWNVVKNANNDSDSTAAVNTTSETNEIIVTESISTEYSNPAPSLVPRDPTTTTTSEATSEVTTTTTTSESTKETTKETTKQTSKETTKETTEKSSGKLDSIADFPAGTVISSDKLDTKNLGKYFTAVDIKKGDAVYKRINGKSYRKNNDISLSDLRYLKMLHVNFNGKYQVGELIVNKKVANDVLYIFKTLCKEKYQIYSMYLIDDFWTGDGDSSDNASIDKNNTSAFCYRKATGSSKLSKHAYGLAIDLNPQQNPYVTYRNGKPKYSHKNAADYVTNRSSKTPHVITTSDRAYKLFRSKGWSWGGSWSNPKDYQHFQHRL